MNTQRETEGIKTVEMLCVFHGRFLDEEPGIRISPVHSQQRSENNLIEAQVIKISQRDFPFP